MYIYTRRFLLYYNYNLKTQPNSLRPCSAKTDAHWEDLCGFVTNQVKQRGRGPRHGRSCTKFSSQRWCKKNGRFLLMTSLLDLQTYYVYVYIMYIYIYTLLIYTPTPQRKNRDDQHGFSLVFFHGRPHFDSESLHHSANLGSAKHDKIG